MTTFVDDSTNYYGNKDPELVQRITQKNYNAIEDYMTSNKLKINGDKSHLLVLTKGDGRGGGVAAARRRERVTVQAGGKTILPSENETLLGGIIHQSGNWKEMIRHGKGSVMKQLTTRINALKIIGKNADFSTRLMLAGGLVQAKLTYLLPLFGGAPDYLINGLQVQQLTAARVIVGHQCYKWSTQKILERVGWLSVRQLHVYSVLMLTHRVLTTGRPQGLHSMLVSEFPYATRRVETRREGMQLTPQRIRYGERFRQVTDTSLAGRSFRHQALVYNQLPVHLRCLKPEVLKPKLKRWVKRNIRLR